MAPRGRGRKTALPVCKRALMPSPPPAMNVALELQNEREQQLRKRKIEEAINHNSKRSKAACISNKKEKLPKNAVSSVLLGLNDMPNEVLALVFCHSSFDDLFTLEKVCRRFHHLMKTLVWKKIHTINHKEMIFNTNYPEISDRDSNAHQLKRHKFNDNSVKMIFSRTKLVNLDLSVYSRTLTYQLVNCFPLANRLEYLNLSHIRLTNSSLRTIGRYCPSLQKVVFEQCFSDGNVEKGLEVLFTNCPKIRYLNLAENNKLDGESFQYIPEGVAYLNLAGCYNIPVRNLDTLTLRLKDSLTTFILENYENANVAQINRWLQTLTKLKKLELASWFVTWDNGHLNFSFLKEVETLKMSYNFLLTSEGLRSLQYCSKIRSLDLSYCVRMEDNVLSILKKCKTLEACRLDGWGNLDADVIDFVQTLKLRALSLNDCSALKLETVVRIVKECKTLEQFFTKITVGNNLTLGPDAFNDPEIKNRLKTHPCDLNITIGGASYHTLPPINRLRLYHVRQKPESYI